MYRKCLGKKSEKCESTVCRANPLSLMCGEDLPWQYQPWEHGWLRTHHGHQNSAKEHSMSLSKRYAQKQAQARQRRRLIAQERLARDRRQAQQAAQALEQALEDLSLPEELAAEIEGRLRSQQKLLSKICGVMFPPLFGCRTNTELCRVRGWDKNLPSRLLSALTKRSWLKRFRRLGLEVLVPLWRHIATKSDATRSRWQWTWVADDSVFKKYGDQLGLVGTWWSGQEHRVLSGIDGVLLVVVIGEGKLVVPVDFAIRRPDPTGSGAPCRDKLHWVQIMLDERVAAFRRRGVNLPPPMVVADSWFSDSKLMRHVATTYQGTVLVEGKSTYVFELTDGHHFKGHDLQTQSDWLWRQSPQAPGMRYARFRAISPTYGAVTIIVVDKPGEKQFYVMCLDTTISATRLIRAWKRRWWIEYCFRTLKHLLATGACQVHSEDAYYGHLVLRLMGCLVLFYTSRVICKGRLTMEEILFSLKHYWRFVDCQALELKALSQGVDEKTA
jgi:DDE superfamily endonuclease